jgi:hypothetical protein
LYPKQLIPYYNQQIKFFKPGEEIYTDT